MKGRNLQRKNFMLEANRIKPDKAAKPIYLQGVGGEHGMAGSLTRVKPVLGWTGKVLWRAKVPEAKP